MILRMKQRRPVDKAEALVRGNLLWFCYLYYLKFGLICIGFMELEMNSTDALELKTISDECVSCMLKGGYHYDAIIPNILIKDGKSLLTS